MPKCQYDSLEQRRMFAFAAMFDGTTLEISQVADDGVVEIDNNGPGNAFRVSDLNGTSTFTAAENVVINLMDGINSISMQLDHDHLGDMTFNMGEGGRALSFIGASNAVMGNLAINAGIGEQFVNLTTTNELLVGENLTLELGSGSDSWTANELVTVGQDVVLDSVNRVNINEGITAQNVIASNFDEEIESLFNLFAGSNSVSVAGDFSYDGNDDVDELRFIDVTINGATEVALGHGFTVGPLQQKFVAEGINHFGSFALDSGDTTNIEQAVMNFPSTTSIAGDLIVDMGEGPNSGFFKLVSLGGNFNFLGGESGDTVQLFVDNAGDSSAHAELFGGSDYFQVTSNASFADVFVDFGAGMDNFSALGTQFDFDAQLLSLNDWNHVFDADTSTLTSTEVTVSAGTLEVEVSAASGEYIFDGQHITEAENVNILMADGSTSTLRLANERVTPVNLNVDLGNADRVLGLSGSVNEFLGDVTITGGAGQQIVLLDPMHALSVSGDLNVDLGADEDLIADLLNGATIGGDFNLKNTNRMIAQNPFVVGGNMIFDAQESVDNEIVFTEELTVGGDVQFDGGLGRDEFRLNGPLQKLISGNLNVDLGSNEVGGIQWATLDSGSAVLGNVKVESNVDGSSDFVVTAGGSYIGGNTYVDLGQGSNEVVLGHENGGDWLRFFGGMTEASCLSTSLEIQSMFTLILALALTLLD